MGVHVNARLKAGLSQRQIWCSGIIVTGFVGFLFYYIPDVLFFRRHQCQTSWVSEPTFRRTEPFMK